MIDLSLVFIVFVSGKQVSATGAGIGKRIDPILIRFGEVGQNVCYALVPCGPDGQCQAVRAKTRLPFGL